MGRGTAGQYKVTIALEVSDIFRLGGNLIICYLTWYCVALFLQVVLPFSLYRFCSKTVRAF